MQKLNLLDPKKVSGYMSTTPVVTFKYNEDFAGPLANTNAPDTYGFNDEDGKWWPSSEHKFQADKLKAYASLYHSNSQAHQWLMQAREQIRNYQGTMDPIVAGNIINPIIDSLANQNPNIRNNFQTIWDNPWGDQYSSFAVMYSTLWHKVQASQELQTALKEWAAKGVILIEHSNRDKKWASGPDGEGDNWLGIDLMLIGNQLLKNAGRESDIKIPDPISYYQFWKRHWQNNIPGVLGHDQLSLLADVGNSRKGIAYTPPKQIDQNLNTRWVNWKSVNNAQLGNNQELAKKWHNLAVQNQPQPQPQAQQFQPQVQQLQPMFFQPAPTPQLIGKGYVQIPKTQKEKNLFILTCLRHIVGETGNFFNPLEFIEDASNPNFIKPLKSTKKQQNKQPFPAGTYSIKFKSEEAVQKAKSSLTKMGLNPVFDPQHGWRLTISLPLDNGNIDFPRLYKTALAAYRINRLLNHNKYTTTLGGIFHACCSFFQETPPYTRRNKVGTALKAEQFILNGLQNGEGLDPDMKKALNQGSLQQLGKYLKLS